MNDAAFAHLEQLLDTAFERYPEFLRPLIDPRKAQDVPWKGDVARTKRFLEWWSADREFRQAVNLDARAADRLALGVDAEELRFVWDEEFYAGIRDRKGWVAPKSVQQYRAWIGEKFRYRERVRRQESVPQDPRHAAWRRRQVNRTLGQLGINAHENIIHAPFAIELSEGCSVGCWFCGVSAEEKKTDFLYTEENRQLWTGILEALRQRVGPSAAHGFMYWATDPLDNPDYEKFGLDFARICGRFPQTTTAQPQKHIERVRALLKMSAEHGCTINRFSVLSIGTFRKIMAAFTAEELLHTELVLQNREGNTIQSNSGRARGSRELDKRAGEKEMESEWRGAPGTIACISGYLVNMVQRTVRLITPCPSTDAWPNGYWVVDSARFRDAADFAAVLDGMMERHMPTALRASDRVRLRPDLKLVRDGDQIHLKSYGLVTKIIGPGRIEPMVQHVVDGTMTAGEIAIDMEDRFGLPAEEAMASLNWLFDEGLLDEEPCRSTVVAAPLPSPAAPGRIKETAS
ncbi:MAG TPA: radical SAM family RiPP maturation amino acid epimerase [Burkholderiales bacterium]|nr:radical SAM family RiPP maturation amino acid epimerase [Burkholderiales bacterium]